jgi:cadmium resistance protein CadD (predicted permease)
MTSLVEAITLGAIVFASTNADDLVLLAAFFADDRVHPRSVVAGQLLGIGALTAASAAAARGAQMLPAPWVALLGLVPLGLGSWKLAALRRSAEADGAADGEPVRASAGHVLAVASGTLASGGDNLGVYIPLFAARPGLVGVYAAVFGVLTLAWCALGWWIVRNRSFGHHVRRWGRVFLPVVLVLVGLHVLRGALPLLGGSEHGPGL